MNLNRNQIIGIMIIVVGVLGTSTAQLTDVFGPQAAKVVVSLSSMLSAMLGGIITLVTGQGSVLQQVQAMPGVDKIVVNARANSTLASLAVDPQQDKIEAAPGADRALQATASS